MKKQFKNTLSYKNNGKDLSLITSGVLVYNECLDFVPRKFDKFLSSSCISREINTFHQELVYLEVSLNERTIVIFLMRFVEIYHVSIEYVIEKKI